MDRRGLFVLFFLSGVSALLYELTWQRLLYLVFGVSTLAVSAVLVAFMGGLALGGLLLGQYADRCKHPLRLYAVLEAGTALTSLLVPPGFALLTEFYTWLAPALGQNPWAGTLLRLGLAFAVLAIPATLLGGTMPVLGRLALHSPGRPAGAFSLLYGINTLGAVAGAALTGLVLLRFFGMARTLHLAAGLNALAALAAALWSLRIAESSFSKEEALPESPSRVPLSVLALAILTGAITIGLEVAWTRILGVFTSNSAYAFALVLSVMLGGLGLGSLLHALWSRRPGDNWRRLAACQWLLAVLTVASLPFFRTAPIWLQRGSDGASAVKLFAAEWALTAIALFPSAILMGLSFPLLVAGLLGVSGRFGKRLGRLYAGNTLGCAGGAFLAGFVLIPAFGIQGTMGVLVAGNLGVGLVAWALASRPTGMVRWATAGAVVLAAAGAWYFLPSTGFLKSPVENPRRLLYYREGNNATVCAIEEPNGTRSLYVDGQPVAGTASSSVIDQKMLAHLPLLLHPQPRHALTIGFGSGGTSYSMTRHGIRVDCVEIERAVPDAAAHFRSENHDILTHPRFRLIVDDARSWLRVAPLRYDAIVTDCTNIQYKSSGDLYTVEYFRLMRQRLADGGIAAAWVPANGIDRADLKTLLRSFRAVFPHASVWFMNAVPTDFLIVIGTPAELNIDLAELRQRMTATEVRADLERVGLTDPGRLLYTFLTAEEGLDRFLGDGPSHTDDRPVLSYSTYGANFRGTIADNLVSLLACRSDVARYVRHADQGELLRQYVASNEILLGHVAFFRQQAGEALNRYVQGAELLPNDSALRQLVARSYLVWAARRVEERTPRLPRP